MDLETQDHILNYQLPVAIKRYNVGLVVIDSITSNYRAEHTAHDISGLSTRSGELAKLGQMLRNLAASEDVAIVVANQVSDRFEGEAPLNFPRMPQDRTPMSSPASQQQREYRPGAGRESAASPLPRMRTSEPGNVELNQQSLAVPQSTPNLPSSSPLPTQEDPQQFDGSYLVGNPARNEILSLQHQQRFFTGWGDSLQPLDQSIYPGFQRSAPKTPTLGLVWVTQIACRIALKKYFRPASIDPVAEANSAVPTVDRAPSKEQETTEEEFPSSVASSPGESTGHPENSPARETAKSQLTSSAPPPSQHTEQSIQRTMKLAFSPWAGGSVPGKSEFQNEVEFEIWRGGIRALQTQ